MAAPPTAPRMSLGNLRSQEVLTAQFNPEKFARSVGVTYSRLGVLGFSSEVLQYQFRPNEKLTFELKFDRLSQGAGTPTAFAVRAQLDAMTVGSRGAQDVASGGPPDVLILWPGVVQMIVRVTKLDHEDTRFSATDNTPTFFSTKIEVEESRTNRLYAEDIRQYGIMRGGA